MTLLIDANLSMRVESVNVVLRDGENVYRMEILLEEDCEGLDCNNISQRLESIAKICLHLFVMYREETLSYDDLCRLLPSEVKNFSMGVAIVPITPEKLEEINKQFRRRVEARLSVKRFRRGSKLLSENIPIGS